MGVTMRCLPREHGWRCTASAVCKVIFTVHVVGLALALRVPAGYHSITGWSLKDIKALQRGIIQSWVGASRT